jgi:hypothetical protein
MQQLGAFDVYDIILEAMHDGNTCMYIFYDFEIVEQYTVEPRRQERRNILVIQNCAKCGCKR